MHSITELLDYDAVLGHQAVNRATEYTKKFDKALLDAQENCMRTNQQGRCLKVNAYVKFKK